MQGLIFISMLSVGLFLGMWLDLLRVISGKCNKLLTAIIDLLFWASVICLVFVVLMELNYLELRLYAFVSMGLGTFFYYYLLSNIFLKLYHWTFETLLKVLRWLWRISWPLRAALRAIGTLPDILNLIFLSLTAVTLVKVKEFTGSRKDYPPST
jgi:spore cortex biosynthesis protein YabQ